MTDEDKRGVILEFFYDHRQEDRIRPTPEDVDMPDSEINRISKQLDDAGLIDGIFANNRDLGPHGKLHSAVIKGAGSDVVEGNIQSPIPITINNRIEDNRRIEISNSSNFEIDARNQQEIRDTFRQVQQALQHADASEEEKRGALERFKSFAKHPLVVEVLGGLL